VGLNSSSASDAAGGVGIRDSLATSPNDAEHLGDQWAQFWWVVGARVQQGEEAEYVNE
jgi:hypothetical protein